MKSSDESCASRWHTYGGYPGWRVRRTLFATPGCWCARCRQLREPAFYALTQALTFMAAAWLRERLGLR
jgi:hypothetical protein